MANMTVDTNEARLITVLRAIDTFGNETLVSGVDVGVVLDALNTVVDLGAKEKEYTAKELKAMIFGFVAGMGASRLAELAANGIISLESDSDNEEELPDEIASQTTSGGPTGGVVAGQGNDPRYVTQSGVHDE